MPVRYAVQIDPEWEDHAGYAIDLLLEGVGVLATRVGNPADADVVYSYDKPPTLPGASVWIQADQVRDWNAATARVSWLDDLPLLYQHQPPTSTGEASEDFLGDIVYSTYALATGALEQQQQKDAWGVPGCWKRPPWRCTRINLPESCASRSRVSNRPTLAERQAVRGGAVSRRGQSLFTPG